MQSWYSGVVPLDRNKHAALRLSSNADFRFAATQVSLPLCLEELPLAAPFYPIVFSAGEPTSPLAVTGLHRDENLFVDQDGRWAPGVYVPAVVRNYPFIVLDAGEGRELVGVDTQSSLLGEAAGEPLFEGGEPTELCKQRIGLCLAYRESMRKSLQFGQALREAGCLRAQEAQIVLAAGDERLRLDGFMVASMPSLDQLSDETFLQWRREGWLSPLFHHLASVGQWQRLIALAAARAEPPASARSPTAKTA